MSADFDFRDDPPKVPEARLANVPNGESRWIVLGFGRGLWLHWVGKRTEPCDNEACPAARHRKPVHWTGYLSAAQLQESFNGEAPKKGERHSPYTVTFEKYVLSVNQEQMELLREYTLPVIIHVKKTDGKKGFFITKCKSIAATPDLPVPFPVEPTLYRLFGRRPSDNGHAPPAPTEE